MDIRARVNFVVDKIAGLALVTRIVHQEFIESKFPFKSMRVYLGRQKMTGSPKTTISRYWDGRAARDFYHDKHILSQCEFHLVVWDEVENAMLSFPRRFHAYVAKHVSKFSGTNRQLSTFDACVQNVCPSCGKPE